MNEILGVLDVPNDEYEAKLKDMNMRWLRDLLVDEEYRGKIYCPALGAYFFAEAWRLLALVGRRIRPSGNLIDVTYPRTLMVACAIRGIQLNVGT